MELVQFSPSEFLLTILVLSSLELKEIHTNTGYYGTRGLLVTLIKYIIMV